MGCGSRTGSHCTPGGSATWTSPALGAVRLTGRLVWTRLRRIEQTLAGDRRALYESGLEFTSLTPAQQTALTTALATLQAAQAVPEQEPPA